MMLLRRYTANEQGDTMRKKLFLVLVIGVMSNGGLAQTIPSPTLSSPSNGAINQPVTETLSWKLPTGYYIASLEWDTTKNISAASPSTVTYGGRSFVINLSYATTYYWMAATTDSYGSLSAWTGLWSFTTIALPAPTTPILASPSNGSVNQPTPVVLNWGAATAAFSYGLQISTGSNFSTTVFNASGITAESDTVKGLAGAGAYYWHVNAANTVGVSVWSSTWRFTRSSSSTGRFNPYGTSSIFSIKNGIVSYFLDKQNPVELRIYDLPGRKLFEFRRTQSAGNYSFSVKNTMQASGLYIVKFKAGGVERWVTVAER
jgi:hypothetical protein